MCANRWVRDFAWSAPVASAEECRSSARWALRLARACRSDRRAQRSGWPHHGVQTNAAQFLATNSSIVIGGRSLSHDLAQLYGRLAGERCAVRGTADHPARPRLLATRLRRQRPKWPWPRRRSGSLPRRRTQNRPTRGKLPASRFPPDRPAACSDCLSAATP